MLNNDLLEKIEQYHSGNMSAGDIASFENEIASNPELKVESDFQSDIVNGIKEYRKTQLKTRLDTINVSPGWIEFARQSALVKSFGGVAIASLIGSAVYFYADSKVDKPTETPLLTLEAIGPKIEEFTFDWNIPTLTTLSASAPSEHRKAVQESVKASQTTASTSVAEESVVDNSVVETTTDNFTPSFNAPEASDVVEDQEPVATILDKVPSVIADSKDEEPIEVETKNSKSSKIRYKYYDGKLFLNGDFNQEPYEILEINSAKGRRIYLLHQNKYFEVKTTDRLSELPEVTNVKLIQELRLIKENK